MAEIKKLYEIPRGSLVRLAEPSEADLKIWFGHIDGMYSFCKTLQGDVVHLAAWTPVEVLEKDAEEPKKRQEVKP
jgi:hypothetical protein